METRPTNCPDILTILVGATLVGCPTAGFVGAKSARPMGWETAPTNLRVSSMETLTYGLYGHRKLGTNEPMN